MPKPLPDDTWDNLFHPPVNYPYFNEFAPPAFRPETAGFDLVNAWWMAESALLVYEKDRERVKSCLAKVGLEMETIGGWGPQDKGTQGFVACNSRFAIVSFRGTEKDDLRDLLADLKIAPDNEAGAIVHRGFKEALDSVWSEVAGKVLDLRRRFPSARVYLTGHSLGAALATLAASRLEGTTLYTFGSPRVGNRRLAARVTQQTSARVYRFVNCQDIVTLVPPEGKSYTHVGEQKFFDEDGLLLTDPGWLTRWKHAIAGLIRHGRGYIPWRIRGGVEKIPGRFTDRSVAKKPPYLIGNHSPGRYPVRIWNRYEAEAPRAKAASVRAG